MPDEFDGLIVAALPAATETARFVSLAALCPSEALSYTLHRSRSNISALVSLDHSIILFLRSRSIVSNHRSISLSFPCSMPDRRSRTSSRTLAQQKSQQYQRVSIGDVESRKLRQDAVIMPKRAILDVHSEFRRIIIVYRLPMFIVVRQEPWPLYRHPLTIDRGR